MTSKKYSKKNNTQLTIFQEIYQAAYFLLYRKMLYRRKSATQVINIISMTSTSNRGHFFSLIQAPVVFITSIFLLLKGTSYLFQYGIDKLMALFIIVFVSMLILVKLSKINRRYFINQKRYQTITQMKWTDFSIQSRVGAIVYFIVLASPFLCLGFGIYMSR